ncbi:MAG: flagellar export protein FliJ [Hyphomicrobiaceae bacterium]
MKRSNTLSISRRLVDQARRKVEDFRCLIGDMEAAVDELGQIIDAEEGRTKVRDRAEAQYSIIAKSARERRNKLRISIDTLNKELAVAIRIHDRTLEAFDRHSGPEQAASKFDRSA